MTENFANCDADSYDISDMKSNRTSLHEIREKWKDDSMFGWMQISGCSKSLTIECFATNYLIHRHKKRYHRIKYKISRVSSTNQPHKTIANTLHK